MEEDGHEWTKWRRTEWRTDEEGRTEWVRTATRGGGLEDLRRTAPRGRTHGEVESKAQGEFEFGMEEDCDWGKDGGHEEDE